jgi:regulator of RNase E activity RraA
MSTLAPLAAARSFATTHLCDAHEDRLRDGRVLVVDGAARLSCALVGGNLAVLGECGVVLAFPGVTVGPGDWIYADRDGRWVSSGPL